MSIKKFLNCLAVFILISLFSPATVLATTLVVDSDTSHTCDSGATPPCYRNITDALTNAIDLDTIEIHPGSGPYTGTFSITKKLTIVGTETGRTILDGSGSGTIFTVNTLISITIKKLSFQNASSGILLTNAASVEITNCVFRVGTNGSGIDIQSSSSATITNNTFFNNKNGIAIASGTSATISNNIFASNTGVAVGTGATATLGYNCFSGNADNGQIGDADLTISQNVLADPKFVPTTSKGDFHLQTGSPCIDAGTGTDSVDTSLADIGAYGGSDMDTTPFPISDLAVDSTTASSITVKWSANAFYLLGGYKVYYGTVTGTYGAPLDVVNVIQKEITGLSAATGPTGAPTLTHTFSNNALNLMWSSATGATGYEIRFATDPTIPPYPPGAGLIPGTLDVGPLTSFSLGGLTNGITYNVIVVPYASATYYIAVTVYDSTAAIHESNFSNEVNDSIGGTAYGDSTTASNMISDFPEAVTPNPELPNKGCFIATAAYGYYSAPQVQALREFRDRYLTTNALGRAFVRWYYQHGPVGAQFINEHPWLKPIVRTALMPAVGGAMFMTRTSMFTKTIVFMFVGLLTIIRLRPLQKKDIHHENI